MMSIFYYYQNGNNRLVKQLILNASRMMNSGTAVIVNIIKLLYAN